MRKSLTANFRFTTRSLNRLKAAVPLSGLSSPIPGIFRSQWDDESGWSYRWGLYERSVIQSVDGVCIVEADGNEFVLIDPDLIEDLNDRTLDIDGSLILILD